ncbi:hypothetical protein QE152_g40640 [Popillia japonica]|uniref:Uncharacterized protein n=1 Tax=Popillia japonica TaxID=7064 RepID=A0AAW1HGB8_POPJA
MSDTLWIRLILTVSDSRADRNLPVNASSVFSSMIVTRWSLLDVMVGGRAALSIWSCLRLLMCFPCSCLLLHWCIISAVVNLVPLGVLSCR